MHGTKKKNLAVGTCCYLINKLRFIKKDENLTERKGDTGDYLSVAAAAAAADEDEDDGEEPCLCGHHPAWMRTRLSRCTI